MKRRRAIKNSILGLTTGLIFNNFDLYAFINSDFSSKRYISSQTNEDNDELGSLKNNTNPSSIHMLRFLGQETKAKIGKNKYYKEIQPKTNIDSPNTTFANIVSSYEKEKGQNDLGELILKGNHELIKGSIALGIATAPVTGGSSLMLAGVAYVASEGLNQVEKLVSESAQNELRRNLKTQLSNYREKTSNSEYKSLLKQTNIEAFRQELEKRTEPILGDALAKVSPEDQYIVNNFYNKELAGLMKDGFKALEKIQSIKDSEIAQNHKDIIGLSRIFTKYAERNQEQLDAILTSQEQLQNGLNQLNESVGKTEKGVEFMQEYMFGKMTPEEQLSSLRSGILDIPLEQRKILEGKIELIVKRQALTNSISEYLNGANTVLGIARSFGISDAFLSKAQTVVNIGSQAFSGFQAFASGNYLAAVGAIAGIFGIGGKDVAAERHEEIMGAISRLHEEVGVIHQKVDLLIDGQKQIMKNQKIILDTIFKFSEEVQKNFELVFADIRKMRRDIYYNRRVINAQYEQEYTRCRNLVFDAITGKRKIDTSKNYYPSYKELDQLFRDFATSFDVCDSRMQNTRALDNTFHPIFLFETYSRVPDSGVTRYLENVWTPVLELFKTKIGTIEDKVDLRVSSLLSPMNSISNLNLKVTSLESVWKDRFRISFESLFDDILSPSVVVLHGNYILDIHHYYTFIDSLNTRLLSLEEIKNLSTVRKTGYYALFEALNITDIAIAQQTMLSGDILLPILYLVLTKQSDSPSDDDNRLFALMKKALSNNFILAQNFFKYSLRKEVLLKSNFINYHIALGSNTSDLLKSNTIIPWEFEFNQVEVLRDDRIIKPKGWSLKFNENYYQLPSAEELSEGMLSYQNDLYSLMGLRSRLTEEIAGYEILNNLKNTKRIKFNKLILNSI